MRFILILGVIALCTPVVYANNYTPQLYQLYKQKSADYTPRTQHIQSGEPIYINKLIKANSPYLLQHAHNPVHWQQFTSDSLAQVKAQNKLIFLSIGYATCHWCHVMAKESFDDTEVAKLLNSHYISLKVDREVQPDVDAHFMQISRILNGTGGWPLNIILTPNNEAFFASTYLSKKDLLLVLAEFNNLWHTQPEEIIKQSKFVKDTLEHNAFISQQIPNNISSLATTAHYEIFDELEGGFGDAPKFPRENTLLFLINEQLRSPDPQRQEMIITTLDMMSTGGMYDIVGGGFHRYSIDHNWLTPHFEKMLYNQARMSEVYAKAYMLTGYERYKRVAQRTLEYMLSGLASKNGGFYSGTDADSEGKEGTFFIWSQAELEQIFTTYPQAQQYFDMSDSVLFDEHYILRYKDVSTLTPQDYIIIDEVLGALQQIRKSRVAPFLDNKVILSWNALVLKSLLSATYIIDKSYGEQAQELLTTLAQFATDKGLQRIRVGNTTNTAALFVDYAYLISAYLDAYSYFSQSYYLQQAKTLTYKAIELFWDENEMLFNMSNNAQIYYKNKEVFDGALPSSNAVMYDALYTLSNITGEALFAKYAKNMLHSLSGMMVETPDNHTALLTYYLNHTHGKVSHTRYVYGGRVKVVKDTDNITIYLQPGWHINAPQVLQEGLIPTRISGDISHISYPKYKKLQLSFSENPVLVYEDVVKIGYSTVNRFSPIELHLQACSDKICLPPEKVRLY